MALLVKGDAPPGRDLARFVPEPWQVLAQGEGELGERMSRVWREVGGGRVVFLGADSPDVPAKALRSAVDAVATVDEAVLALGPAEDGGYWTLAGSRLIEPALQGIDWGGADVYHQTCAAARRADVRVVELPRWRDVDDTHDLAALRRRLRRAREAALRRLRDRVTEICQEVVS